MTNPLLGFLNAVKEAIGFFILGVVLLAIFNIGGTWGSISKQAADSAMLIWTVICFTMLIMLPFVMKYWGTAYLLSYMAGTIFVWQLGFIEIGEVLLTNGIGVFTLLIRFGDFYG